MPMSQRPRRLRLLPKMREALAEVRLHPAQFIAPLFVRLGENLRNPIASMPGVYQFSPDTALVELRRLEKLGVGGFMLFGVTEGVKKDALGSHAHDPKNAVCETLMRAKEAGVKMLAMTDLCYCEYTNHGHCGPLTAGPGVSTVDNDLTIQRLGTQAIVHARAGAEVVAPSGMMDGGVESIRAALDAEGKEQVAILAYAVKYASSFYGPFRDAAESPPQFGDRKSYQMDFRRGEREAIAEALADVEQGADMVMVKPGGPYVDILRGVTDAVDVPTAVYQVSGEYAMVKAAAERGWIDERGVVLETMTAFRRAGASLVVTYYAGDICAWLTDAE